MTNGNLQHVLEWGVELGVEIAKDLEDKKLSIIEAIALWDNAIKIPNIVKRIGKIPKEWNAYKNDQVYIDALIAGVESKVSIGSETAKAIVLQSIKVGIEAGKLIELCIKAHKESIKK